VGVSGSTGVRLRAPVEGSEVTTSGSSRLFSAWSIAATKARDPRESIGIEKTRLALLLHTAHVTDSGAVPSGRVTSNTPSRPHRYSYVATALLLLSQQRHIPTGPQPRPRENANTSVDFRVATTSPRQRHGRLPSRSWSDGSSLLHPTMRWHKGVIHNLPGAGPWSMVWRRSIRHRAHGNPGRRRGARTAIPGW